MGGTQKSTPTGEAKIGNELFNWDNFFETKLLTLLYMVLNLP